jgi:hypothetical protein
MLPSIGGLAKMFYLTSFVFTWHYASIHQWAGQNIYLTIFVFTWRYASIHQWAGQIVDHRLMCYKIGQKIMFTK